MADEQKGGLMSRVDVQSYLAVMLPTAVIVLIFVLIFHPLKDADDVTKTAIGALLTVGFASIIGFYFGSSSGSKSKDDAINAIASATVPQPAPQIAPPGPSPLPPAPPPAPAEPAQQP